MKPWKSQIYGKLTFAFSILFIEPTASLFKTIPLTTVLLCNPPPKSFATRTLSTLKFAGFFGHTWMHAYILQTKVSEFSVTLTKCYYHSKTGQWRTTHISNKGAYGIFLTKLFASNSSSHSRNNLNLITDIHTLRTFLHKLVQYFNSLKYDKDLEKHYGISRDRDYHINSW